MNIGVLPMGKEQKEKDQVAYLLTQSLTALKYARVVLHDRAMKTCSNEDWNWLQGIDMHIEELTQHLKGVQE